MAAIHLIRLGAIKGKQGVLEALKHNKRELQSERGAGANIDVTRTPLNYALAGQDTPANIALHAKVQMMMAGIEVPRKNGVMAVEVLFSLPIDRHQQDTKPFFADCHTWVLKTFVGELLSFDVHLDEAAPHAHAVILPLIDNKMQGNMLIGGKGNLMRLINLFHADVARHYGLSRPNSKRMSAKDKQSLARNVLKRLKLDTVMQSTVWPIVHDLIAKDPSPFAQHLGVMLAPATQSKVKSFVDYKRQAGKGSFQR